MKTKEINEKVEGLYNDMFAYWQKHRTSAGFVSNHEQALYDAVCAYRKKEKTWLLKEE